jgi:hypothetical protein
MGYSGIGKVRHLRSHTQCAHILATLWCAVHQHLLYAALRPGWTTRHSTYQASVICPNDVVLLRESHHWRRRKNMTRDGDKGQQIGQR